MSRLLGGLSQHSYTRAQLHRHAFFEPGAAQIRVPGIAVPTADFVGEGMAHSRCDGADNRRANAQPAQARRHHHAYRRNDAETQTPKPSCGKRSSRPPARQQPAGIQLDLMPLQIAQLGSPKPVPVGDQDHGRVPVAVSTVLARGLDQPLDLATGEIAPSPGD